MRILKGFIRNLFILLLLIIGIIDGNDVVYAESEVHNNLTIHVLDVGEGLSLLFESGGHYMLYDGGDREYSSKIVAYLKQQNVTTLDYIVVSHYDSDHLNGIVGALNVFEILNVMAPDYTTDTRVFESFKEVIAEKGLEIISPIVGEQISFGSTIITILAPSGNEYEDENDYSIALLIQCNDNSLVVTGDATNISEREMLISGQKLDADILIIGHHGSDSSTSEEFLSSVSPEIAIISCGKDNQYLHPAQTVMERLQVMGCEILRTDKQGDFIISSNGINWNYSEEPSNDYSYGEVNIVVTEEQQKESLELTYILNNKSKKFHYQSCHSTVKIADHNRGVSNESRDLLISKGYAPCGNCHP